MKKVLIIAQREFATRIRKKSFVIVTALGPIVLASMLIIPIWLGSSGDEAASKIDILVSDQVSFDLAKYNSENLSFQKTSLHASELKLLAEESSFNGFITAESLASGKVDLYLKPNALHKKAFIASIIENAIFNQSGIPVVNEHTIKSKSSSTEVQAILSYFMPIMVYFFIFLYGIQVMKGVIEEKSNRIFEVLLCSVKPWQLMLGKILGISWLSLVQFSIWGLLSLITTNTIYNYFGLSHFENSMMEQTLASSAIDSNLAFQINDVLNSLQSINITQTVFGFLFYFYFGYLLFATLFAIVGAASDVDTETQQFIFPITVPLITSFVLLQQIIQEPNGSIAKALSLFPFSAPVAMPARLSFGNDIEGFGLQLLGSMVLMLFTFVIFIIIAAKIYRIGILIHNEKVGYSTLIKWVLKK